jgi:membrane protease YdiL (CAAX protease family)
MHDDDSAGGRPRPGISPRGAPERPLLEAAVILAAQYFAAYLPADLSALGGRLASPSFYALGMAGTLPGALLILYMMATTDGLAGFGLARPTAASLYRGAALASAALAAMLGFGWLLGLLGVENPIWAGAGKASPLLIPLVLASSAATGYCEELYFRAYLLRRLGQAGLRPAWAIAASTALFAGAHGAQGLAGFATAGILGLAFSLRFSRGRDLHEVALAHAAYNSAVLVIQLYS